MLTRKMKDSGIEWIGEIPEDWEVVKLKNIITFINGFAFKSNQFTTEKENTNKVITISSFNSYKINKDKITFSKEKIENLCNYKLKEKDILFAMSGGTVGKNLYIDDLQAETYYINQRVGIIRSKFNKLIFFNLNNKMFDEYTKLLSAGSAQPNISGSDISKFRIALPPSEKIRKLSYVLDNLDSHVNNIITQTQQSIEELKKYKQSLITEAVTKGLDPNVEMKDSGLEWVGEIPIQWKNLRFGRIISINSELVNPSNYRELPQVSPDDIEQNGGKLFKFKTVKQSGVSSNNYYFFKNQILYSKIRPKLNKVAIAPFDGLCSADMYPIETSENVNFITYLMMSHSFLHQVSYLTADRVKMPKINRKELSSILIVLPSIEEQRQIVSYLDEQTSRIDKLIADKTKVIEELEDYKKSLIYEYVTGKKEV